MRDEGRRRFHPSSFILHPFLIALLWVQCSKERPRPNVLLITLDTFRGDRVGALTPNLERLANAGLQFRHADSAVPLTLPSHATILSGVLPLHHGLRNNGAGVFPANRETLATRFAAAGYRTGAFVSAFVLDHRFGLDRGFERFDDEVPRDPSETVAFAEAERRGGATVDRALAWLRERDGRPSFAWVHLYDAHAPYAPPEPLPQTYDGEVRYVDQQVGRLLDAVDREHTIVVVVGDHGEGLGEHGEFTHGLFTYESTLHVPFIVAGPDIRASTNDVPVSLADVAPTVCGLASLQCASTDGRDVREAKEPAAIYSETQYPLTFGWTALDALRVGRIKVTSARELFDLTADPKEMSNVIDSNRRDYNDLRGRLDAIRGTATSSTATAIDDETRRKLASLGYVAPGAATNAVSRPAAEVAALFRRFEETTALLNRGNARDAIAPLQQLVRDDQSNPVFRATLARAYRASGDSERAIPLYREAVALAPNDADAWYNLASALQESGKTEEAAKVTEEAARRDPKRAEVNNLRGSAAAEAGDFATAEKEFRTAIALDSRDARAWNNLGNVFRATNRLVDAGNAYRRAIEIAPRYADPHNGLGALLAQGGRSMEAVREFDAALSIAPDYYEAQLNKGIALQMNGQVAEARREWQELLDRLPPGPAYARQRDAAQTLLRQPQR
jgi:arylsulfatase A-like enzyme/Flp pilus assembly protein TadD